MDWRARSLVIGVAALAVLSVGSAWAQEQETPEGTIELTGGLKGCASYDHRHMVISYKQFHFKMAPNFDARGVTDDDRESLKVDTDLLSAKAARITVTSTGMEGQGHKICGGSRIIWTATSNDE
jgi:hypothetical protein